MVKIILPKKKQDKKIEYGVGDWVIDKDGGIGVIAQVDYHKVACIIISENDANRKAHPTKWDNYENLGSKVLEHIFTNENLKKVDVEIRVTKVYE